jgi:antirestriction protein ArdC
MRQRELLRPRRPPRGRKRRKGYHRPAEKRELQRRLREEYYSFLSAHNGGVMRIKLKEYYDRMEQAVAAILTNADVRDYLKKIALFRKYSFANTLFIVLQKPSATRVAGLITWNRLGRHVKKGEKGIMIFAPMFGKQKRQEPSDGEQDLVEEGSINGETTGTHLIGFKAVYVYDITQTDGAEITCDALRGSADFTVSEDLDVPSLFEWIVQLSPVPVRFRELSGSRKGYYDTLADEIVLAESLTDVERPRTLIHEIAHKLALSGKEHDMSQDERPMAEVIAEGAAFVVCSYLGIDTGVCSFSYVAAWGKDLKKILSWGSAVMRVANSIIDLFDDRRLEEEREAA